MENIKTTLDSKKLQIRNLIMAGALVTSIMSYAQVSKVEADDISQAICKLYPLPQNDYANVRTADSAAAPIIAHITHSTPGITSRSHVVVPSEGYNWLNVQVGDISGEVRQDVVQEVCDDQVLNGQPMAMPANPPAGIVMDINVGIIPLEKALLKTNEYVPIDHEKGGQLLEIYRGTNNAGRSFSVILGGTTFYNPRDPQGPGAFILKLAKLPAGTRFVLNGKICTLLATIPTFTQEAGQSGTMAFIMEANGNVALGTSTNYQGYYKTGIVAECES